MLTGKMIKKLLGIMGCCCLANVTFAVSGPYVSLMGGGNYTHEHSFHVTNTNTTGLKTRFRLGYDGAVSVGYHIRSNYYELEYGFYHNREELFKYTNAPGVGSGSGSSHAKQKAIVGMLNYIHRFHHYSALQPYVGFGVGAAVVNADLGLAGVGYSARSTVPAYQGIFGVSYVWDSDWSMTLDYRFFGTTRIKYRFVPDNSHGYEHFYNHSANVSFVYYFSDTRFND